MSNYFEYNGKRSDEMGLTITHETAYASPERDIEFVEVVGKDGDVTIDKNRFKSFVYPIHTLYQPELNNIDVDSHRISNWLKEDVRYKPLFLSWDPDYFYMAIFYEQFDIVATLPKFGKLPLNFRCQPFKYKKDSQSNMVITNGQTLTNPEKRIAKPLIKVTGTGNITLKNNGKDWLILTSVDGHLTIDSAQMSVYKDIISYFLKMNSNLDPLFPVLYPGENKITWTGTVTKLEITPRWEAVI